MRRNRILSLFLTVILISGLFLLPACSAKEPKAKKPQQSSEQKPKAPPELEKLQKDLDKIIKELDKMIIAEKLPAYKSEKEPSGVSGGQEQKKDSGKKEESKDKSSSSSKGKGGEEQKSTSSPKDPWSAINQGTKSLHKNWNKLEPEAVKAGLPVSSRKHMERNLSSLTKATGQRNNEESLTAAIGLYQPLADTAQVFAKTLPPDFFRVKYEVMAAMLESLGQDWEKASLRLPRMQENWESLKVQAKDADPGLISCSEFALRDLEGAIEKREIELVRIKGEICLDNLQKLEDKLKKTMLKVKS